MQYTRAFLHVETDDNDLTYFVIHQVELILRALDDFASYVKRKMEQIREVERLMKGSSNCNHRQLALLSHALRHADAEYSIRSHMTQPQHRLRHGPGGPVQAGGARAAQAAADGRKDLRLSRSTRPGAAHSFAGRHLKHGLRLPLAGDCAAGAVFEGAQKLL